MKRKKLEIKQEYYYDTFQAQKTDLQKSWGTLNEALNRNKQNIDLQSDFIYKNKTITDRAEIANSFCCVCHRKERHGSIQKLFYSLSKSGETTIYKYTIKYE